MGLEPHWTPRRGGVILAATQRGSGKAAMKTRILVLVAALLFPAAATASELKGPARFCGFSPIIDLRPGETITTLEGGIHGGSFRWDGPFGSMKVYGIGSAARPPGDIVQPRRGRKPARFAERRGEDGYGIAIWNGEHGAAYFTSPRPFTAKQRHAIARVRLFNEGENPEGCGLRTIFSWE